MKGMHKRQEGAERNVGQAKGHGARRESDWHSDAGKEGQRRRRACKERVQVGHRGGGGTGKGGQRGGRGRQGRAERRVGTGKAVAQVGRRQGWGRQGRAERRAWQAEEGSRLGEWEGGAGKGRQDGGKVVKAAAGGREGGVGVSWM